MTGYVVVLDANVLYGMEVTDFLAMMATRRLFRPHWSPQILDEVERNLLQRPDLDSTAVRNRLALLNQALPGARRALPSHGHRFAGISTRGTESVSQALLVSLVGSVRFYRADVDNGIVIACPGRWNSIRRADSGPTSLAKRTRKPYWRQSECSGPSDLVSGGPWWTRSSRVDTGT